MILAEAFNGTEITLCKERTEALWVTVRAYIKDGKLSIEGQDLGEAPKAFFGSDEYEYYYFFDQDNTNKLFQELSATGNHPVLEFQERFSGLTACRDLREFCEERGIKYRFDSWT